MKKISLKGISKILSEKELKNVIGGGSGCGDQTPVYNVFYEGCYYDGYRTACGTTLNVNSARCIG